MRHVDLGYMSFHCFRDSPLGEVLVRIGLGGHFCSRHGCRGGCKFREKGLRRGHYKATVAGQWFKLLEQFNGEWGEWNVMFLAILTD
jgi:hypothetical protein